MRLTLASLAAAAFVAATSVGAPTNADAAVRCRAPGVPHGCVMRPIARDPVVPYLRRGSPYNSYNMLAPAPYRGPAAGGIRWPPSGGAT